MNFPCSSLVQFGNQLKVLGDLVVSTGQQIGVAAHGEECRRFSELSSLLREVDQRVRGVVQEICDRQQIDKEKDAYILQNRVTYSFSGGRFGDNLVSYFHAKWVSHKYGIPFLYKPFPFSDQLFMHQCEKKIDDPSQQPAGPRVQASTDQEVECALSSQGLIEVPYFPECDFERGGQFSPIRIDWEDPHFRSELQRVMQPQVPVRTLPIPPGYLSIACHIRRGGGVDGPEAFRVFPLKFPQDSFFIEQLWWMVTEGFLGQKLYVYLFTDDRDPMSIKQKYEAEFAGAPIVFDCRTAANGPEVNVLDDFFSLTQFDCAIHGQSNFSIAAGKISNYLCEIQPERCHFEGDRLSIDEVRRRVRSSKSEPRTRVL